MLRQSDSSDATFQWGASFAKKLAPGNTVVLSGELGAGKTTLIKGIVHGALDLDPREVTSPTFTYLHIYTSPKGTLYHFDLYRLRSPEDFLGMGFDEYFSKEGICCIEWPERILPLIPKGAFAISLSHAGENQRAIHLSTV